MEGANEFAVEIQAYIHVLLVCRIRGVYLSGVLVVFGMRWWMLEQQPSIFVLVYALSTLLPRSFCAQTRHIHVSILFAYDLLFSLEYLCETV